MIPDTGKFTAEQFAEFFGRRAETIREWVRKYKIPHYKPGDTMIIDAAEFWKHIPQADSRDDQ